MISIFLMPAATFIAVEVRGEALFWIASNSWEESFVDVVKYWEHV
jgi:hypothetical protein